MKLKKAKTPETFIIEVTGLPIYNPTDEEEFRDISNALANKPTTSDNADQLNTVS